MALVLLRLRFGHSQHVVAELAVEVFDLLLEAKPAKTFLAFDANIHLLFDKLSPAFTFVVYIWSSELSKPIHFV